MKGTKKQADKPKKKRKFLKVIVVLLIITGILLCIAGLTVGINIIINQNFTTTFYQITSEKVSDNIRIVELSDLHNSEFGENNSKLIDRVRSLHPDIIVFAGDMINQEDGDYSVLFDLTDKLAEIAPVYACYGNNELIRQLRLDTTFVEQFKEHNVTFLSNEAADVKVKNTSIQFVAISEDVYEYEVPTNNGKKFIESLEPTNSLRICLTHYPALFREKLLDKNIDIAFTGHSHGGLIRIPFVGGLFSPGEGFLPKYTEGVIEAEDGAQVVISRGLGNSNFFPRINNQPELVVVDICWY